MADLHDIPLPAGWYPDPDGADHRRWWDGKTWTQHTAPFQRPVLVYEIDDLAEARAKAKARARTRSGETPAKPPAPRRIRTAARLGRSLAALAHRLPFAPRPASETTDAADDAATPSASAATPTPAAQKPAAPKKAAPAKKAVPAKPATPAKSAAPRATAPKPSAPSPAESEAKRPTSRRAEPRKPAPGEARKPAVRRGTPTGAHKAVKPTTARIARPAPPQ